MSAKHLVYIKGKANPVTAESLRVGDILQGADDKDKVILKIRKIKRQGVYAPLTPSGKIFVNGIQASTYISLQQKVGSEFAEFANGQILPISQHLGIHIGTSPMRTMCLRVSEAFCQAYTEEGILSWVSHGMELAAFVEKQNTFIQSLWLVLALSVCLPFYSLEKVVGPRLALFILFGFIFAFIFKKYLYKKSIDPAHGKKLV